MAKMDALFDNWPALELLTSAATAAVLIIALHFDERFGWFGDELRWRRPLISRVAAILRLGTLLSFGSLFLSAACIFAWNRFAESQGRPAIPDLAPSYPPAYFKLAIIWHFPLLLVLVYRCRRHPLFDVFLSYKNHSGDTELVRRIADQLTSAGLRVWFAEYRVLLRGRKRPERYLHNGVRASAWGLAFTNNKYIESEWCRREIQLLLDQLGPERLLEIQIPREDSPRQKYKQLGACPSLDSRDMGKIVDFLEAHTRMNVSSREPATPEGSSQWQVRWRGRRVSLDIFGWELHEAPREEELNGVTFRYAAVQPPIFVNVWAHPETSELGQQRMDLSKDKDGWEMFDYLVSYARQHLRQIPAWNVKLRGVHVLFHSDLRQVGLTYWSDHYWTRKVSLVIPNRSTREEVAEFEFTFGFAGSYPNYCRYAYLMDQFALSLDWQ